MRTISTYTSLDLELPEEDIPNSELENAIKTAIIKEFTGFVVRIDQITRDSSGNLVSLKFSIGKYT